MAHWYVMRRKINSSKGIEKELYYAVPVIRERTTTEKLAERISANCTFTQADISGVLSALAHQIMEELEDGRSVHLEKIGTFSLSITSDGYEDPDKCIPSRVEAKRICFRMDNSLRKKIKKITYRKIE